MALSDLEKTLLRDKIQEWIEQGQGGINSPNDEIYQAILATEPQLQNGLESYRLQRISLEEQSIDGWNVNIADATQNIDDLTP